MRLLLLCLIGMVLFALASARLSGSDASETRISYEISADGPAVFFAEHGTERNVLWKVDCTIRLRNCIARGNGLVLAVDTKNNVRLGAMKPPGARVSIQMRNQTVAAPNLLNEPLSQTDIERLDKQNSFVLIEDQNNVISRSHTQGLLTVISYLNWVSGPQARSLRDARLWPDFQFPQKLTNGYGEHRRYLAQRHQTEPFEPPKTVPVTKPQIEFAISAQGGRSFYSETGRAGY